MPRNLLKAWTLGLTAYALVYTREVPVAYAQSVVDTDCSTNLDQPDTTYRLTAHVSGNCIIAADNIILDGQNLYEIDGYIAGASNGSFTIRNIPAVSYVSTYYTGNITIESSTIGDYAYAYDGTVTIVNATVEDSVRSRTGSISITNSTTGNVGAENGDITINDSNVSLVAGSSGYDITLADSVASMIVSIYDASYGGSISITNSTINGPVGSTGGGIDISIVDSVIDGSVHTTGSYSGDITVTNSTITGQLEAGDGEVTISGSTVENYITKGAGDLIVTDSSVESYIYVEEGDITVTGSDIGGSVERYNGGDTTTIINSTVAGDLTSYSGYAVVTDATIEGHINRTNEATITGSHIHGYVRSMGDMTITASIIDAGSDLSSGNAVYGYNTCDITDATISPTTVSCGTLNLTDNAPSLTVTPLAVTLTYGETFNPFSGIHADDVKDGDISDQASVIGTIGEEGGVYELIYSVTDNGTSLYNAAHSETVTAGPSTVTATRTVTRGDKAAQSTSVGVHKDRKEKEATEALHAIAVGDIDGTLHALKAVLSEPITTNDPEQLKKILNLLLQIAAALTQLLTMQGK